MGRGSSVTKAHVCGRWAFGRPNANLVMSGPPSMVSAHFGAYSLMSFLDRAPGMQVTSKDRTRPDDHYGLNKQAIGFFQRHREVRA